MLLIVKIEGSKPKIDVNPSFSSCSKENGRGSTVGIAVGNGVDGDGESLGVETDWLNDDGVSAVTEASDLGEDDDDKYDVDPTVDEVWSGELALYGAANSLGLEPTAVVEDAGVGTTGYTKS